MSISTAKSSSSSASLMSTSFRAANSPVSLCLAWEKISSYIIHIYLKKILFLIKLNVCNCIILITKTLDNIVLYVYHFEMMCKLSQVLKYSVNLFLGLTPFNQEIDPIKINPHCDLMVQTEVSWILLYGVSLCNRGILRDQSCYLVIKYGLYTFYKTCFQKLLLFCQCFGVILTTPGGARGVQILVMFKCHRGF